MRRKNATVFCLALLALAWLAGGANVSQAQYCGDECCSDCPSCGCAADNYCGECDYCSYYGECADGYCDSNCHGGHLYNAKCCCPCCQKHGWDGKRRISYQCQKDLFYNYYAQPGPFYNTPGKMYVSPLPVPANVGHTYTTYQPFMPHEYLYRHNRSYYTHNPGAGWTRTNVRYGTCGNCCKNCWLGSHFPMSNNIWPMHNDFYYPGLRF